MNKLLSIFLLMISKASVAGTLIVSGIQAKDGLLLKFTNDARLKQKNSTPKEVHEKLEKRDQLIQLLLDANINDIEIINANDSGLKSLGPGSWTEPRADKYSQD